MIRLRTSSFKGPSSPRSCLGSPNLPEMLLRRTREPMCTPSSRSLHLPAKTPKFPSWLWRCSRDTPRNPLVLLDENNVPCNTALETRQRFQRHHASLLHVDKCSKSAIAEKVHAFHSPRGPQSVSVYYPTPEEIPALASTAVSNKVAGEDALPIELLKAFPEEFLRLWYPLVSKV